MAGLGGGGPRTPNELLCQEEEKEELGEGRKEGERVEDRLDPQMS